ncbi:type III-A CRISPR-associated RAMP protein Csm3 [Rudanella lutea]|uniref:type III-A CRISPR-associated RAMP protein Csm3 n=1 Tax=Rudanella lutea TaxID=451374 RepID=UPI0003686A9A|nr:type III-A CRISPR-associated RAMP protein Csm3 [Rudanella lutea]
MKLHKKLIITGRMTLLTGLHIGDSKDNVEIGGVDNPVVRRKDNNEPYIPGSSLKGKLRSLLEVALGEGINAKGETSFDYDNYRTETGKILARLFGSAGDNGTPARIQVRDAYLTREWAKLLYDSEFTDMPYTEVKFENRIDRIKGTAEHPRQTERIPAGAEFEVQFVVNIITPTTKKGEDGKPALIPADEQESLANKYEKEFLALLEDGIRLLEDDYLGGSGSRGYGQITFDFNGWQIVKDGKGVVHKQASDYLEKSNKPVLA